MSELLSRRAVLLGGSALAFMAACGKKSDKTIKVGHTSTTQGQKNELSTVLAGSMLLAGIQERVTFALFQGVPATLVGADSAVHVAFQKPGTNEFSEPIEAERKSAGIEDRPYYMVHYTFDEPGNWGLRATVDGKTPGDAALTINDPAKVEWPVPGKPLFAVQTPTVDNTMDVNPICTRADGTCPFHTTSLDAVLGKNGKPTVALLATPALCQSATCGPVLEILMADSEAVRDKLNIVHVEVYSDMTGKTLSPAFAAFHTDSEPVMYLADKHGVVTERFNGPFDKTEAADALQRLLA
ncbi:MAG TPA: hypothetical protein VHC63_02700 [Acidimicrobiales bacterium]|nr:hypothetical protein [Acidimicrobiales bacterium]